MISPPANILLLTGLPGIGKTTIVRSVADRLSDLAITGFYTEEIRKGKIRQGFELVTFTGKRITIAHVDNPSPSRVGKYGVDVPAIEQAVRLTLAEGPNPAIFIIDEIGKMECLSPLFVARMTAMLDSGKPVLATVALKGGGFIGAVKRRPGVTLWQISKGNRNDMPDRVLFWISKR